VISGLVVLLCHKLVAIYHFIVGQNDFSMFRRGFAQGITQLIYRKGAENANAHNLTLELYIFYFYFLLCSQRFGYA